MASRWPAQARMCKCTASSAPGPRKKSVAGARSASGELRSNVMASAAIPGVFPLVPIGEQGLVDGGVVAHVPILPAKDLGCRSMLVFDAGFPECSPIHPGMGWKASSTSSR